MAFIVSQKMDAIERQSGYSVNTFTITDLSNYVSEGLDVNDFIGVLKIVFNSNTIYDNTNYDNPDISVGLGSKTFPLVLDSDGSVMLGTYQITLSIKNENTEEITTNTTTYTYNYEALELSILLEANGYESTLTSQDVTDYGTISVSRTHVLTVPIGSGLVDQTTTSSTISLPADIWSGEYETTLTNILTHVNGSLTVVDEVVQSETLMVYNLSRDVVFEAVSNFNELYNETIGVNPKLAVEYGILSNRINGYLREYQNGVEENDGTKCYNALTSISLLLSPDFISDLFTATEEIVPYDFRISTDAEALAFIQSLTATSDEINRLHNLTVSGNRVIYTNGSSLTSKADFTFDGNDLNIPIGGKYKVNGIAISDEILSRDNHFTGENQFDNLSSPVMTGIPTSPTASKDTDTTQVATTEFVLGQGGDDNPLMNGSANAGISKRYSRGDHVHPTDTTRAPLESPVFTGNPKAPTSLADDNSTNIATTEFVQNEISSLKKDFGMYDDTMSIKMSLIRNPQMDNLRPTGTKIVYNPLKSGAFTSDMIGKQFVCTDAGSWTGDFRQDTTALLKDSTGALVAANTALTLNAVYLVYAAGIPNSWGGTELTCKDVITQDKWYICKGGTVTYNGTPYSETTWTAYPTVSPSTGSINIAYYPFKGVSGITEYTVATGTPIVYELDYLVIESTTGNGTGSGTITLNWVPYIYSLFHPETGKEWAIKRLDSRQDILKITGGDYASKRLNFVAAYPTTFSSTTFHNGNLVSLYNPYESIVDIDWSTRILSSVQAYSWANNGIFSCGLFKRKTDDEYCGIFLGRDSENPPKNRIGYYTTPDFSTITIRNNYKPIFDGALTDIYLSSGNLTIGNKYKIIATQTNHFGAGVVVGDYIVAAATTACDANNIVRLVDNKYYWNGFVSSLEYLGQTDDGSYLWELLAEFRNKENNIDSYCFIRFDETFSDKYMKFIPVNGSFILLGDTNDSTYPNMRTSNNMTYTYYDGKHRIFGAVATSTGSLANYTYPWITYEYVSETSKYGPYTSRTVIYVRDTNDSIICNRDVETFMPFVYNNELYAISVACSASGFTGMDADRRAYALWKFSKGSNKWYLDHRSPILMPPINENKVTSIWSGTSYASSHVGGIFSYCIDGDIMHVNVTSKSTGGNYTIFYGTVDLTQLTKL